MRSRLHSDSPFTCVTCQIEITGPATFHLGLPFCCSGCAAGGPCTCSYDDAQRRHGVRECLDIQELVAYPSPEVPAGHRS